MASPLIYIRSDYMPYLKGIWKFKDVLSTDGWGNFANKTDYIKFSSNNMNFEFFANFNYDEGTENYWYLRYGTQEVYLFRHWSNASQSEIEKNVWLNEAYKTVNFGTTDEYVTDNFYLWFTANATLVNDLVPIITSLTNVVGRDSNATTVAINGSATLIFDPVYGYSFSPPLGTSELIVTGARCNQRFIDNSLYLNIVDVYSKVTIAIRTFTYDTSVVSMVLYNNSSEKNRVDKTAFLLQEGFLAGILRKDTSIITPSIVIEYAQTPSFNYVFMPIFNRYYYVNNITSMNKNLWLIDLVCDVLMTYKDKILEQTCVIGRQEHENNDYLIDDMIPSTVKTQINTYSFPETPFGIGGGEYVLTVVSKEETP